MALDSSPIAFSADAHALRAHDLLNAIQTGAQVPAHAATVALAHAHLAGTLARIEANDSTVPTNDRAEAMAAV